MESNPRKNINNEQYELDNMILQNMNELNKVNQYLHEYSIEIWRIEEKCRIKTNSIKEIENSITLVNTENKWLEEKLHDTESSAAQVRDTIISMDNIMVTLFDTLTDLEIKYQNKEFSKNRSRKNFDLQIILNMEMCQNEEERLNNIPKIKALRIAESELENMKLEYEELLIKKKKLVDKISKANKENNKKMNDIIIKFANLYVEMKSINKEKEISRALLSKLDSEYNEKLNIKNALLVSKKKTLDNTPLWSFNDFYPHDSKIINLKLDSLKKNLKLNFNYSSLNNPKLSCKEKLDIEPSKFKNKPKKNVTFLLHSEDKILHKNDITLKTYKNVNTNLVDTNISKDNTCTNSIFIKDIPKVNVDTDKLLKSVSIDPIKKNVDYKKIRDIHDIDFQTNKRKKTNNQFDFQFKKPNSPVQVEIYENKTQTKTNPTTVNSSINKKNNPVQVERYENKTQIKTNPTTVNSSINKKINPVLAERYENKTQIKTNPTTVNSSINKKNNPVQVERYENKTQIKTNPTTVNSSINKKNNPVQVERYENKTQMKTNPTTVNSSINKKNYRVQVERYENKTQIKTNPTTVNSSINKKNNPVQVERYENNTQIKTNPTTVNSSINKKNNPVQVERYENKTQIKTNPTTVNSSINKKNKFIDIQEEIEPKNTLMKNNKHGSQKIFFSEFTENSHLTKPTSNSGNINLFDNVLQYDERSSYDQNNILSGMFWNDSTDNMDFEGSEDFSYCDSDDIGDIDQDMEWSFMNSLNNGQSNYQGLNIINSEPSESFKFQPFNNEPIKEEMTSPDNNIFMKASTSRTFSDFSQPIQSHSKRPAEQFRFNFN